MIVIYAEDFCCKEAEKKKLGECHCPKVNLFYVSQEAGTGVVL